MNAARWTVLMLLPGGVFTGAISVVGWERVWLWQTMTIDEFVVDFRRSLKRLDPAMPILLVLSGIGTAGLASQTHGSEQGLLVAAIACQIAILVGSLALLEPINSQYRRRAEGIAPPCVEALRRRWRHLHVARAVIALVAFTCMVIAVAKT